ncbi:enoyl-CoA hydratase/carnithine racemase [Oikeobacillus pervagus]|uniref:Enoyl-CoA hydratase/carnithine racemase n=1 Tax=Oikeobacillus pervagus TaxID=1325931 RepID=A0AAJ1WIJ2_9BACI|nr:enoyl-CoA hydratase [Oikeobacillus pervagus]MDQ0214680.1 enoyl-CoA hydratase/carnithine racemase [Oikeobacillus pervagus]
MGDFVQVDQVENGIALITLARPEAANALSKQLLFELHDAIYTIKNSENIRVVIITGKGEKAFCAGADLKERKGMSHHEVKAAVHLIRSTVNDLESLPQPVIAAMNGVAFGGGLELALACDIRIASKTAKFGLTEAALAIIPGAGGTQRLPRLIGLGKAKELIYTAKRLDATEAAEYGVVEYVAEPDQLLEKAISLAKEMAKNAPLSLVQAKVAINKGYEVDLMTGLKIEELAYSALIPTEDRMEGLRAFQEKRPPQYKGR